MLTEKNRTELMTKAKSLLNTKPFSKQAEAEFVRTVQLIDLIDADRKHDNALRSLQSFEREERDTAELRVQEEWHHFVHRPFEKRTYSALQEGGAPGSAIVPFGQWLHQFTERLISSSGWLKAGATLHQTNTGTPYVSFFSDDETAVASITSENQSLPQANSLFAAPKPDVKNFSTSVSVSNQLVQDAQFELDGFLQGLFATRVARAFNTFATSDATYGLLSQLTVGDTAATTVPSLGDLADMQDQIDPAYLEADSQPCYMMSQSLRNILLKQVASSGNLLYPEIKQGQLLGLPLIINTDMTANAGDVAVVCGSVKRAVLVQSVNATFIRSAERNAEFNQTFYGWVSRLGVKLIDGDAVTALKLHA